MRYDIFLQGWQGNVCIVKAVEIIPRSLCRVFADIFDSKGFQMAKLNAVVGNERIQQLSMLFCSDRLQALPYIRRQCAGGVYKKLT